MRKTLLFLLLLSVKLTFAQFQDNFSDGNFTENPKWTGQTANFNISSGRQLKSALSSVGQTVMLCSSNLLALNVKWEFSVQLNFDPSTTNFTRIYLIADQQDLKGNLNGYFIQIGENGGADSYDLYKQAGGSISKIIDGLPRNRANINFLSTKFRVTRDDLGNWKIYTANDSQLEYQLEGGVNDNTFALTKFFGVYCKYTATRSDGFAFDDILVEDLVPDILPPKLRSITIVDENSLEATFSEELLSPLIPINYRLKESNEVPLLIVPTTLPNVIRMSFSRAFQSGNYTLIANNVTDLKGNRMEENSAASTFYIQPHLSQRGDVVINEVFADPSPQVGLPTAEFVELWNTTDRYIVLTGWKYGDLTSTHIFLADTLEPKQHLILCATDDVNLFKPFGKVVACATWPTLNNDQDKLSLLDYKNNVIDEVHYSDAWYKDQLKDKGGYSLELLDPINRCTGIQNWQASVNKNGGTPGIENSTYQLQLAKPAPKLIAASQIDETTIKIQFNSYIDSLSASMAGKYRINNNVGIPVDAHPQGPDFSSVILKFSNPFTRGIIYTITVNDITDCAGNLVEPTGNSAELFSAKDILPGDFLINEILVNPKIGGVDFIEIYNTTDHKLDLSKLQLANITSVRNISSIPMYVPAKTFWVLTSDMELVSQHYDIKNPRNFTRMEAMPTYTNETGAVILQTNAAEIDRLDYNEKMHFPLLQIVKGISLERVSLLKPSNEIGNFKSAAQNSGFATPTSVNSQQESLEKADKVWLSSKVFSPNGDGVDDALLINYNLGGLDYLASVIVFDQMGIPVKKLLSNSTIAKSGQLKWDGLNDSGSACKIGIYMVRYEMFALNGVAMHFDLVCVLANQLN